MKTASSPTTSCGNRPGGRGHSLAGDFRGTDLVFRLLAKFLELTEGTFHQEVHDMLANDKHAVVLLDDGWQKPKPYTGRSVHTRHVRGGKATEFWIFSEDRAAADASFRA